MLIHRCWHRRSPWLLPCPCGAKQPSDGENSCWCYPRQLEKSASAGALVWCRAHDCPPQRDDCRDQVIAWILSCREEEPTTPTPSSFCSTRQNHNWGTSTHPCPHPLPESAMPETCDRRR